MGAAGRPMVQFFDTLNEIVMKLIMLVMWYILYSYFLPFLHVSTSSIHLHIPSSNYNNKL